MVSSEVFGPVAVIVSPVGFIEYPLKQDLQVGGEHPGRDRLTMFTPTTTCFRVDELSGRTPALPCLLIGFVFTKTYRLTASKNLNIFLAI